MCRSAMSGVSRKHEHIHPGILGRHQPVYARTSNNVAAMTAPAQGVV